MLKRPRQVGLWLPALETFIFASASSVFPHPFYATQHRSLCEQFAGRCPEKGTLASMTSFPASFWSDDNECLRDPCAGRGRCINSVGSYSCLCYPGYTLAILGDTQECQGEPDLQ